MKLVELFLFLVCMLLGMVLVRLAVHEGGLHRLWPQFFDAPPAVCTRGALRPDDWQSIWPELAESNQNTPPALASQAQGAINSEARQAVREVA